MRTRPDIGMEASTNTRRRGRGCLTQLLLATLLGIIAVEGVVAVTAPWAFTIRGHFHVIPGWQGWGRLHSPGARDYVLYVSLFPSSRGSGRGGTHVTGWANLCTPRGAEYSLRMTGGTNANVWRNMDGQSFALFMANRPAFWSITSPDYHRWHPDIELHGRWHVPDLVMDDHGTLSREFMPDGRLYYGSGQNPPPGREVIQVTLKEGSKSEYQSACAEAQRK